MIESEIKVNVIAPSGGMVLTQADDSVNITDRVLTRDNIYLAANDSPANWKEITETEAAQIAKAQEDERKRQEALIAEVQSAESVITESVIQESVTTEGAQ